MAERVVASLADGLWQGALLALGISLLLRVFRFNASTRYVIWSGTLLAVVALPIIAGRYTSSAQLPEVSAPSSFARSVPVLSVPLLPSSSATTVAPLRTKSFELTLPARWSSYVLTAWLFVSLMLLLRLARATRPAVEKLKAIAKSEPEPELRLDAVRYLGALARSPKDKLAFMPMPDLAPVPMLAPPPPLNPPKPDKK